MGLVNHKWIEELPEGAFPIQNGDDETAFAAANEGTGIFFYVKVYCCRKQPDGKHYKTVKICMIDIVKQIWNNLSDSEHRELLRDSITEVITN